MKFFNKIWFVASLLFVLVIGNSAYAADFTFTRNLAIGISGADVSALQQFLIDGGFLKITAPTAYFGPLTRTALGKLQVSLGIFPSVGFFGPISREKINGIISQASASIIPVINTAATSSVAVANNGSGLPVRLKIPKINVDAGFQYNGLKSDGTMEIPSNIIDVGWFTGSPYPGEKGNSIITGHVAQIRGGVMIKPGVFGNLSELGAGDKLYVTNDRGEIITFVVRAIRNYDPAANATDVFVSNDNGIHLNLITCEGTWNPAQASYSQRLVVFTDKE